MSTAKRRAPRRGLGDSIEEAGQSVQRAGEVVAGTALMIVAIPIAIPALLVFCAMYNPAGK